MKIMENSKKLFDQDKDYVIDYLKERGVNNSVLYDIINNYEFGLLEELCFKVNEKEYCMSHFLTKSKVQGYDIRKVNGAFNTDGTNVIIYAMLIGDDALCYNIKSKKTYIWKIQSGDGKKIPINGGLSKLLKEFIK